MTLTKSQLARIIARMRIRTGQEIKEARRALRLTQRDFAAICSIRHETLSRIERGADKVPGYVEMILSFIERGEHEVRFALSKAELLPMNREKPSPDIPIGNPPF